MVCSAYLFHARSSLFTPSSFLYTHPPPLEQPLSNLAPLEHTLAFHRAGEKSWKTFTQQYNSVLKSLRDEPKAKNATVRVGKDRTEVSLRSTYLCLQCPIIFDKEGMKGHFEGPKVHSFCKSTALLLVYLAGIRRRDVRLS